MKISIIYSFDSAGLYLSTIISGFNYKITIKQPNPKEPAYNFLEYILSK